MPYNAARTRDKSFNTNVLFIINFENYWSSDQLHSTTSRRIFALEFKPTVTPASKGFYDFKALYNIQIQREAQTENVDDATDNDNQEKFKKVTLTPLFTGKSCNVVHKIYSKFG
jgi:hypothetical protein